MGEANDSAQLEKGTLVVRKRSIKQGPATINIDFANNKATGSINGTGQDKPIAVDLGGPLFADAAGSMQSIACLPLAEGYSTTFRNFDLQKQKERLMQLKVVGVENVTVPAGSFDSYKIEVTAADGGNEKQTMWIAKDSHKAVKLSAVMVNMGGAVLTAELEQ
jgi:hypothetical protein